MFLRRIKAKDGKKRTYWALVKSVRTARGPRHQVVSYLGELQAGEKSEWANLAHIVATIPSLARFCEPSSELHVADTWYQRTSLDDLMGVPVDRVNPDRLYRAHDHLLKHKDDIERHLKERYTTLFDAQYELLLYDVTSTYFEGEAKRNPQAQRGHSRDHRDHGAQARPSPADLGSGSWDG